MLEKLKQTTTASDEKEKKKFLKELKIQKLKLKPLVEDYKLALEKLKNEMNNANNNSSSNNNRKRKNNNNDKNWSNNNKNKKFKSSSIENK